MQQQSRGKQKRSCGSQSHYIIVGPIIHLHLHIFKQFERSLKKLVLKMNDPVLYVSESQGQRTYDLYKFRQINEGGRGAFSGYCFPQPGQAQKAELQECCFFTHTHSPIRSCSSAILVIGSNLALKIKCSQLRVCTLQPGCLGLKVSFDICQLCKFAKLSNSLNLSFLFKMRDVFNQ